LLLITCAASQAQTVLPLDDLMAHLAQASQRRGTFVEEKSFPALAQPLRSTGHLAYVRPSYLEKITIEPQPERLVVEGDQLFIDTGNGRPRKLELGDQPEISALIDTIRGVLSGDLATLRQSYDMQGTGSLHDWRVVLHPRNPALAKLVREVRIAGGDDIRTIESVQPDGGTDRLTITPSP
jgi:Outer membrane lipoprotein carrier protein LolA-like